MNISPKDFSTILFCSELILDKGFFDDDPQYLALLESVVTALSNKSTQISRNDFVIIYTCLIFTQRLNTNHFDDVKLTFSEKKKVSKNLPAINKLVKTLESTFDFSPNI